jgi:hypothetical protein
MCLAHSRTFPGLRATGDALLLDQFIQSSQWVFQETPSALSFQ